MDSRGHSVRSQPTQQVPQLPPLQNHLLPPTKIKRQYKCTSCDHTTINPRQHLRHRIDVHGHKLRIVECPLCVYACQYRQKLNRHLRLVHHCLPNQVQARLNLMSQQEFEFGPATSGDERSGAITSIASNLQQQNQLSSRQDSYPYSQIEFLRQLGQQLYDLETKEQQVDRLKCPMLHSIHAYASQLVTPEGSDDEPMDLSFPVEIKQIMRSFEGQPHYQQPQYNQLL